MPWAASLLSGRTLPRTGPIGYGRYWWHIGHWRTDIAFLAVDDRCLGAIGRSICTA